MKKIDDVLHALADPTRRKIFEQLSYYGERTVRDLYEKLGVTQQGAAQHLIVLERAGLVTRHRRDRGVTFLYRPRIKGMAPLTYWLTDRAVECPKPRHFSRLKNSPPKPNARQNSDGSPTQSTESLAHDILKPSDESP